MRRFTYDGNGNLLGEGTKSCTYDAENKLITASGVAGALVYDPLGRLFQIEDKQFLYDGDELVSEYGSATPLNVIRRYVHGPAEYDPCFWYEGSGVTPANRRSVQSDHQGSIVSIANSDGTMLGINSYDEYGIPSAGNTGRFHYTGQAWLPELGMYYYKARNYSPRLGRFLQTDPVGYGAGMN